MKLAKRGRNNMQTDYTLKDAHSWYNKSVVESYKVSQKVYLKVLRAYNKMITDAILNESETLKLPSGLGYLRIIKKKIRFNEDTKKNVLSVDWNTSLKINKIVYHLNKHRDGHRYKWYWNKTKMKITNGVAYRFNPTRQLSRRLAKILKTDRSIDYYE